jgi:predicted small metal-binding protein
MTKLLRCRDVGFDCDAEVRGETDEAILAQVVVHARDAHGVDEVPDDVVQRAIASIREEGATE